MSTPSSLAAWLAEHTEPFTLTPGVTVPGLASGQQAVVGVGVVTRNARQLAQASHAVLATLVRQSGFRAVFLEGTDATGPALDRYVTRGLGDPVALAARSQSFLRTRETVDLLKWLRSYALATPGIPFASYTTAHRTAARTRLRRSNSTWRGGTSAGTNRPGSASSTWAG